MTTEEQYTRIIEQNDEAAKQYAEECQRNAEHRALCIRESKTLRDEFACSALTGLIAATSGGTYFTQVLAEQAYAIADAMLAERAK